MIAASKKRFSSKTTIISLVRNHLTMNSLLLLIYSSNERASSQVDFSFGPFTFDHNVEVEEPVADNISLETVNIHNEIISTPLCNVIHKTKNPSQ